MRLTVRSAGPTSPAARNADALCGHVENLRIRIGSATAELLSFSEFMDSNDEGQVDLEELGDAHRVEARRITLVAQDQWDRLTGRNDVAFRHQPRLDGIVYGAHQSWPINGKT